MKGKFMKGVFFAVAIIGALSSASLFAQLETQAQHDARLQWWREARFGLFIHWGLYAVPAGEWNGKTNYAEWIRNNAHIPLEEYEKLVQMFDPNDFNADEWVRMAKDAGMKYIVITSKHHDGFCLFDSRFTDFDIMSTPFKRDVLKELSEACRKQGIKLGFYYSIMDWHHPDYLPRRDWEKDRPTAGANFDQYVQYMKNELKELLTNYGPIGVLWFDGEWEATWTEKYGRELYQYVRSLQPDIIINNRVGASRSGMEGFSQGKESAGDFGTPEQQIPATGLPGLDWETCMTMNDNWGYNSHDSNWKSAKDLTLMLADIASKGGNFLLNDGPRADGQFPMQSMTRLAEIGSWLRMNGESIYGTQASPFKKLAWGRCTQKAIDGGTRLFLHVFQWPVERKLVVPGIFNKTKPAYLLADPAKSPLAVNRNEDALVIDLQGIAPNPYDNIVVLDVEGRPDISDPPDIKSEFDIFLDTLDVSVTSGRANVKGRAFAAEVDPRAKPGALTRDVNTRLSAAEADPQTKPGAPAAAPAAVDIRYTLDGTVPSLSSLPVKGPIHVTDTSIVSARCFRDGQPVSATAQAAFTKVKPRPAAANIDVKPGALYSYYEGDWDNIPDFAKLRPAATGISSALDLSGKKRKEYYGFEFTGYLQIPKDGVVAFFVGSDDGSDLYIDDTLVVDNEGLHGMQEKRGLIALAAGPHPFRVRYFNKSGGDGLTVSYQMPGLSKQPVSGAMLGHR
jgi:alpha-L-fucosidase